MEFATLNNGVKMPMLGYGVYQVDAAETRRCVRDALSVGYRLIDTAQAYGNEEGVGQALRDSGLRRDEVFITSKVWIANAGQEKAAASIDESLRKLGCDYIDLYTFVDIKPAVNQIETHVFQQQKRAHAVLAKYGVLHQSWGPFAEGRKGLFTNPTLVEIGAKHNKSAAQVALRFLMDSGVAVIPKSTHIERMEQNFDVFDFALDGEDKQRLAALDEGESAFFSHYDPETVEWFMSFSGR